MIQKNIVQFLDVVEQLKKWDLEIIEKSISDEKPLKPPFLKPSVIRID